MVFGETEILLGFHAHAIERGVFGPQRISADAECGAVRGHETQREVAQGESVHAVQQVAARKGRVSFCQRTRLGGWNLQVCEDRLVHARALEHDVIWDFERLV